MTVRAIDMITLLPRAGEAARGPLQAQQQPHVLQHAQGRQHQARAKKAREQVAGQAPAEQAQVRKDGGGRQGAPGQPRRDGRRGATAAEGQAEVQGPPGVGQRLDVKI